MDFFLRAIAYIKPDPSLMGFQIKSVDKFVKSGYNS